MSGSEENKSSADGKRFPVFGKPSPHASQEKLILRDPSESMKSPRSK
jgi:hypothetical protein